MAKPGSLRILAATLPAFLLAGLGLQQRDVNAAQDDGGVSHADCEFFGPKRNTFRRDARFGALSELTIQVVSRLPARDIAAVADGGVQAPGQPGIPRGSRSGTAGQLESLATIDRYLFAAMQEAGVNPAPKTTDAEFIRRVSLDLTGRIPDANRVVTFLADTASDKRTRLVDELLAKPEWVDKWTMYYGDLFKNSAATTQIQRYAEGRNAFYNWIKSSLQGNKRYDQLARELISVASANTSTEESSYTKGEINWLLGGVQSGGVPIQDTFDQQAANAAQTFLGLSHLNCILCHDGAGHLTELSLWGKNAKRTQGWQMASFFSRTSAQPTLISQMPFQVYYSLINNAPRVRSDYQLNTTTGNRPARTGTTVAPLYIFSNRGPAPGEDYRTAFARELTADFQFARATVNYIWKEFFGRGIVDPPDQFDLSRLDPDNPPPAPWSLQPSNARLLNALAQDFINSGYDLKALMRQITTSQAYQLSSRYEGTWNPAWEPLFARHMVRRLWAEEIHDALAQASNILPSYTVGRPPVTLGPFNFAMQLPETAGTGAAAFLDSFLRGDRIDDARSGEASILQAMNLMNDPFVMSRIRATGSGSSASLLARNIGLADDQLVNNLFLAVLSRYPTAGEMSLARANLTSGNRQQEAENLLWLLYNKVDFIFNY